MSMEDRIRQHVMQLEQGGVDAETRMTLGKVKELLDALPVDLRKAMYGLPAGALPPGTLYSSTPPADQQMPRYNATTGLIEWITVSSGGAPTGASYITQTPDPSLTAEQALSTLATGMLKNTTGTGVLSIATPGTDYAAPGHTHTTTPAPHKLVRLDNTGNKTTTSTAFVAIDTTNLN